MASDTDSLIEYEQSKPEVVNIVTGCNHVNCSYVFDSSVLWVKCL